MTDSNGLGVAALRRRRVLTRSSAVAHELPNHCCFNSDKKAGPTFAISQCPGSHQHVPKPPPMLHTKSQQVREHGKRLYSTGVVCGLAPQGPDVRDHVPALQLALRTGRPRCASVSFSSCFSSSPLSSPRNSRHAVVKQCAGRGPIMIPLLRRLHLMVSCASNTCLLHCPVRVPQES